MKTDNELIAKFMGLHFHKVGWVDAFHIDGNYECEELKYHSSWDWLMPVVEKINSLYEMSKTTLHEDIHYWSVLNLDITATIKEVHWSVIEFIKWYNSTLK